MSDFLDYSFVPFGNAYYPQSDCPGRVVYSRNEGLACWQAKCGDVAAGQPEECFAGAPLCQHGDSECAGDLLEACAVDIAGVWAAARFTYCYEGVHELDTDFAAPCAASAGIDYDALSACAANDAATINTAVANATAIFAVENTWVGTPTAVLNGVPVSSTSGLLAQVCKAAGADAPAGCTSADAAPPPAAKESGFGGGGAYLRRRQ